MEEFDKQVIKRIEEIISYYNLSVTRLAKSIGMSFASISKVLNYHQKASPNMIDKIRKAFPDVDIQYIVTGVGTLLKRSENEINIEQKTMTSVYNIIREHEIQIKNLQTRVASLEALTK